jgi:hypothetical protein
MTGNRWGSCLLISLVALVTPLASAHAGDSIYLYDQSVVSDVDLGAYEVDGTVRKPDGGAFPSWMEPGPTPSEFPSIAIAEPGIELLGFSNAKIDGIRFINYGNYLKPDKKTLVLWIIRIPNAFQRSSAEFAADLNLTLFVDWNQDMMWSEGERIIQKSLNLASRFPTSRNNLYVFYLTSFRSPDVTMTMESNKRFGRSGKDIRYMWARAVLSCDDPDASPDGAQLFGGYEDYRLAYRVDDDHDRDRRDGRDNDRGRGR